MVYIMSIKKASQVFNVGDLSLISCVSNTSLHEQALLNPPPNNETLESVSAKRRPRPMGYYVTLAESDEAIHEKLVAVI